MSNPTSQESLYLREQRRFRRLEASLPVWLANADEFDAAGAKPWSLGYTRDISMGGSTRAGSWKKISAYSRISSMTFFASSPISPIGDRKSVV